MIRVLVVDDEALTASAHAEYVARCAGFEVAGVARNGTAAVRAVRERAASSTPVDLVLLDLTLPDISGLEVARALRAQRAAVDLLIVTAHRDVATVRDATAVGVVGYLVKPFTFDELRRKLEAYAAYHRVLAAATPDDAAIEQAELDRIFAALVAHPAPAPPKGLAPDTLEAVAGFLREAPDYHSAGELARELGLSRVTARRYLEHLCAAGSVDRRARHGTPGRPELEYGWRH